MKEFIQSFKFKVIVCIFALLIGFMIYAAAAAGAASLPEVVLKTITAPFARISTTISTFVEGNIDKIVNADKYKSENEELRKAISNLREQIVDIDKLINDNRLLREMLEITEENPDFEWPQNICTIIASNSGDVFGGFTIDRGSNDGIALQDLVITSIGVVGIISRVAPNYSQVSTILSTDVGMGVLTTRGNITGLLQNDIVHASEGLSRVILIDKDADIEVGDIFVTSGGPIYPAGRIIGEVVEVYDDPNGMTKHALVKPSEDIFRLNNVFVITGFEGREVIIIDEHE